MCYRQDRFSNFRDTKKYFLIVTILKLIILKYLKKGYLIALKTLSDCMKFPQVVRPPIFEILNRMRQRNFDLLGEIANVNIGLLTGADKVSQKHIDKYKLSSPEFVKGTGIFVIDKYSPLINKLNEYELSKLRPFYKNSDIYQFYTKENNDLLLIDLSYPECELLNPALVPNLYKHLSQFKEILQNRKSNDNGLQAVIKKGLWWTNYY